VDATARSLDERPLDEFVSDAPMIPFCVIVVHELSYEVPKVPFAQRHDAIKALPLNRSDEALRVRIAVRCGRGCANHANADRTEQLFHRSAPLRIPIADQDSARAQDILIARKSSERLHDERLVRVWCHTQHVHAARMQLDDERGRPIPRNADTVPPSAASPRERHERGVPGSGI
jgi:hypothetical protein